MRKTKKLNVAAIATKDLKEKLENAHGTQKAKIYNELQKRMNILAQKATMTLEALETLLKVSEEDRINGNVRPIADLKEALSARKAALKNNK